MTSNRTVAGLTVEATGALLALGATPAMADDRTATIPVLHAVPGTPVGVYANGELLLDDCGPGTLTDPRARVEPVGVRDDGQLALPDDVDRAGWYRFGPAPGDAGSAVVAGHVDDEDLGLGELAPLRTAEPGDRIRVTDADGTTTRWRVVSREVITKRALPLEQLFRRDGSSRPMLITCGGPFLPEAGAHRDTVVVVAELVP